MTTRYGACPALALLGLLAVGTRAEAIEVAVCTDLGNVTIELLDAHAPLHTANFLHYVESGAYSGTAFHRVLAGSIVQAGGYDRELRRREVFGAVANESRNGLENTRGTVAAARTSDPDSAMSQFFINVTDNPELDASARNDGYTVFGTVTSGMDVIDAIARLPTRGAGPFAADVPEPVVAIASAAVIDRAALDALPEPAAEHLRERIAQAAGDPHAVLGWVDQLRALCAAPDARVLHSEAAAAAALNHPLRARYALEDYFRIADATEPGYAEAEALYAGVGASSVPGVGPLIARCIVPNLPLIPNGRSADLDAMLAGQAAVRSFMDASELYLDCLSETIDEDGLDDVEHSNAVRQHNQMVRLMEELAEDFNREVRAFKSR